MSEIRRTNSILILLLTICGCALGILLIAQASEDNPRYTLLPLFADKAFQPVMFDDSIIAGLVLDDVAEVPSIIVPVASGALVEINGESGEIEWQLEIPRGRNQQAYLSASPVKIGTKLVVSFQILENGARISHRMAVVDLINKCWDVKFSVLELRAEKKTADGKQKVKFNPPTAYSRAALKHASKPGSEFGVIYSGFGNANDTQPFHGWLFEIDMDAWLRKEQNKIINNVLLTTPEAECPVTVEYGTQEMICGGGIWSPAGPQIYPTSDGYELFVATGNGQVDFNRNDFANSLLRVKPGLQFDPSCDAHLCENFNPSQPDELCLASCKNLFVPRLPKDSAPLKPASHECDGLTFAECLAWMDYDLGGSPPVKAKLKNKQEVLVQPGKDGAIYLIDANHLGTQFDRLQIADLCGTKTDPCKASWMGMIVAQPVVSYVNSEPVVVIPTYMPDKSHSAGLVAVKIISKNGQPKFNHYWRYPNINSNKAKTSFRNHPSLSVISKFGQDNDEIVWVVDVNAPGMLYGIRIRDGKVVLEQSLIGTGRQLSAPIIFQDKIYLASTQLNSGKTFVEAYQIVPSDK